MATKKPKKRVLRDIESSKKPTVENEDRVVDRLDKVDEPQTPVRAVFAGIGWLLRKIVPKYFVRSFRELRLVSWPNRKETRQLTTAVIIFAIAVGLVVAVVDYGLDKVFRKVILKQ